MLIAGKGHKTLSKKMFRNLIVMEELLLHSKMKALALNVTTLSKMVLTIMALAVTLSINETHHNDIQHEVSLC